MVHNKKIIFWGTPLFALPSLQALFDLGCVSAVVTRADKPAGRKLVPQSSPVKVWAASKQIPVLSPLKLDENFIADLKKYLPATFVIVAYGRIIKEDVLSLSELPALNIHPSLLPILRGPSPIQSALWQGLTETGVSLMQLDAEMDHGPILAQVKVAIDQQDDYFSLSEKLSQIGAQLLSQNILAYLDNQLTAKTQDDSQATYCKLITKEDGLLNWQLTSQEVLNQLRAFKHWPGSFTKLGPLELIIETASLSQEKLNPGQWAIRNNKLYIGCVDLALEIIRLQPANKKLMSAADFIRGYQKYLN